MIITYCYIKLDMGVKMLCAVGYIYVAGVGHARGEIAKINL
jgi:hypothetical protein